VTTLIRLLTVVLVGVAAVLGPAAAQDRPLAFGVLNQQSPALTAERWNPILHYLTSVSGVPLELRMGPTVQDTNAMMARGEGRRIAFPSPDAFVGYAVPLLALRQAGVKFTEVFAGNQDGVLAQLKARRVDAGAVNSRFLRDYQAREHVRFREVAVSAAYPDLAVIVHPRVPAATVEKVRQALIGLERDARATPLREQLKFKGFEPATDRDYDGVRLVYRQIGQ
jgi:phosphonate transport system substrate-binding protein